MIVLDRDIAVCRHDRMERMHGLGDGFKGPSGLAPAPDRVSLPPPATMLTYGSALVSGGYSGQGPQAIVWRFRP